MLTIRVLIAASCALAITAPAAAEVFQIISAGKDGPFVVDCPQSPEGRALNWVAANCRLTTSAGGPAQQVIVHGWNPKDKKAVVGTADGDPDRPVIMGTVPNAGNN
jgi:hypothetical protein